MRRKNETFNKLERLKKKVLFNRLFKEGKYLKGNNFSLLLLYNNLSITRLGISVQKKIFPKATQRNRVKRLIREVFRKNKGSLTKGCDILIRPLRQEVINLKYNDFEKGLLELFKMAGVLK